MFHNLRVSGRLPSFAVDYILPNTMATYSFLYFFFFIFSTFGAESKLFIFCQASMGHGLLNLSYAIDNTASIPSGTVAGVYS
jgi:hypothetical protein